MLDVEVEKRARSPDSPCFQVCFIKVLDPLGFYLGMMMKRRRRTLRSTRKSGMLIWEHRIKQV